VVQLTFIAPDDLPAALAAFAQGIADDPIATAAFARISARGDCRGGEAGLRAAALAAMRRLGIPVIDEEPACAFSWDGRLLRARSEACVLFHEIAHWQLAAPARRALPDFGLGAGPETGRKDDADRARTVDEETCIAEECAASLLGILWEADCGGPALDAFLEQNWLERFDSAGTHRLFQSTLAALFHRGLIDGSGAPTARDSGAHALVFAAPEERMEHALPPSLR
jgi:hypothetical protein